MLASDQKVALESVYRRARKLAAAYEHGASLADDDETVELFTRLARSRTELVGSVAQLARRAHPAGEPPGEPDQDRIDLARAGRRIETAFARDPAATLVRDRLEDEAELDASLEQAWSEDLDPATREAVQRWRRAVAEVRASLQERLGHD